MLISKTTKVHQDHHLDGKLATEQVGFVFLNDNDEATFVHGDEKVLVKSGRMVAFQGDVPHNMVIHSGNVKLLGPFALSSFQAVGTPVCPNNAEDGPCPDCEDCLSETDKDCFSCKCIDCPPTTKVKADKNRCDPFSRVDGP